MSNNIIKMWKMYVKPKVPRKNKNGLYHLQDLKIAAEILGLKVLDNGNNWTISLYSSYWQLWFQTQTKGDKRPYHDVLHDAIISRLEVLNENRLREQAEHKERMDLAEKATCRCVTYPKI